MVISLLAGAMASAMGAAAPAEPRGPITVNEVSLVMAEDQRAFDLSDVNGDGFISDEELYFVHLAVVRIQRAGVPSRGARNSSFGGLPSTTRRPGPDAPTPPNQYLIAGSYIYKAIIAKAATA